MASPHFSKRHRALLRKELVEYLPPMAGASQSGGIAGRGTDFATLAVLAHQAYATSQHISS
eukprot:886183-Pyramimonas_sp.AAC.1